MSFKILISLIIYNKFIFYPWKIITMSHSANGFDNPTRSFIGRRKTRLPHLAFLCSVVARASSIFSHEVKYRPESHSSSGNGPNSGQRIALLTGRLDGRRDFQCLRWNAKSSYGQRHPRRRRRCNKRRGRCIEAMYGYYIF